MDAGLSDGKSTPMPWRRPPTRRIESLILYLVGDLMVIHKQRLIVLAIVAALAIGSLGPAAANRSAATDTALPEQETLRA